MKTTERLAALVVPAFPVALFLREKPEYGSGAVVVADGDEEVAEIVAAGDRAAADGVLPGLTVAQGRLRTDNLLAIPYDREAEATASSRLMNRLQNLTPYVEEERPGAYFLEVSGMLLLYKSEYRFAQAILELMHEQRLPATVGVAGNPYVATVAADVARAKNEPIVIVPEGSEKEFLSPLAITHLPVSAETLGKLRLLGIDTIGRLAAFAPNELISRFEEDGVTLARLSHGVDTEFFTPVEPDEDIEVEKSLLYPVATISALVALVEPMLTGLLKRLRTVSRGCACLDIELTCEDKQRQVVSLALESPGLSARPFVRQLKQKLAKTRLSAGVTGIRLMIPRVTALVGEQLDLARLAARSQSGGRPVSESAAETIEHLYTPHKRVSALPEEMFDLAPYRGERRSRRQATPGSESETRPFVPYAGRSPVGLRLLQPARPVEVNYRNERLLEFTFEHRRHRIREVRGPWRVSGRWWDGPFERWYYEVTLDRADARSYLLFAAYDTDRQCRWYLQGLFD
ncbi:hypothetical protein GF420_04125 [candidate division GN15 bacterium]|nr:hypothetical protein [candidate division GN15 bacterium]